VTGYLALKKELVVKDNALINASYHLSLVEQRLVLLAIIEIRKPDNQRNHPKEIWIHAEDYIQYFKTHRNTAYQALKDAAKELFSRQFSYQEVIEGKNLTKTSRWVSEIGYALNDALVSITFSESVKPLILELERCFTYYEIEQIANLSSAYAVRLYELLIQWRSIRKTPVFELATFRGQLGLGESEYRAMGDFKKRVLDPAITQISQHTDITVTYEQHKRGRVIVGFSFKFKKKKPKGTQAVKNTSDSTTKKKPRQTTTKTLRSRLEKSGIAL
jgi:plasmid replication initiation protein